MGILRIVEQGDNYASHITFPAFYMNDFSVMGIVVSELDGAIDALAKKGFTTKEESGEVWVSFNDNKEMRSVLSELSTSKINYTISDLVSCAYQG